MHRRKGDLFSASDDQDDEYEKSTIKKTMLKFDLHDKIKPTSLTNSVPSKSHSGAFFSIFLFVVMVVIVWEESNTFFKPITEDFMMVDTDYSEELVINFDLSFYKLTCNEISVDAVDYNGEQQISVDHEIYKSSRDERGSDLGMYKKQTEMGSTEGDTYLPDDYCGSCFGASTNPNQCCNTCATLKRIYRKYGRAESLANSSPQCVREKKYGVLPNEYGCRVRGTLRVNKMEGNFHIAAGFSHPQRHQDHTHHIHHINKTSIQNFDISHHINHLSFGEKFYPAQEFPLDNTDFIADGLGNLVYFIQLVPTVYETRAGAIAHTNQFSAYSHYTPVDTNQQHYKLPGVFFKYEFYPMRISYVERSKSFLALLVRVFAVLGGMYAIIRVGFTAIGSCIRMKSSSAADTFSDLFH